MLPTLAAVAAAIESEPHPAHRADLEELAAALLQLRLLDWRLIRLRARWCRLSLDAGGAGGDDDSRDPAAA